jgi:hypothetical protein
VGALFVANPMVGHVLPLLPLATAFRDASGRDAAAPRMMRRELACQGGTDGVGQLFAPLNERLAEGTVALADSWGPDLVLHEGLAPVGSLAAVHRGVPGCWSTDCSSTGGSCSRR